MRSKITPHHRVLPGSWITVLYRAGLCATLCLDLAAANTADAPRVDLRRYESQHYAVRTTLRRSEAVPLASHMDRLYAELARRFEGFRTRHAEAMPLYLFRTSDEYTQFMETMGLQATNTAGMFFVNTHGRGLATWGRGRGVEQTLRVLQHEGFHQFAYRHIGVRLPVWVNEGLAQYFGDGILVKGELVLGLANERRIAVVREAIAEQRTVPFDELLDMDANLWAKTVTAGQAKATLLYAQSWAMVYFLVHGEDEHYRPAFDRYLASLGKGHTSHKAFSDAFGSGATKPFRHRWRTFMAVIQPDPLSSALARMSFLGEGLRFLVEKGETTPQTLGKLRRRLRAINFRTIFTQHGFQATTRASDQTIYRYTSSNGTERKFQFLKSAGIGLPPRLAAPGLQPEPTLTWSRDADGNLVQKFTYR